MPRVTSQNAKSLRKLCAEFVACNLDRWCNPSETEMNIYKQEATLSPFDELPTVLLEDVIHAVCSFKRLSSSDRMKLNKQSFELLITPHLRNLDLSMGESSDAPYILNLASLRCPDLNTVRLVGPSDCVDVFVHLCALKFERLQVLNISQTDAGDSCLQILGMYCKDLRKLNLEGCMNITDAGIEGLCVSVNHLGKEDRKLGQCKSIEALWISETKITKKGIQTALKNLPFLKLLNIDSRSINTVPVQLLEEMHQPDSNKKQLKDICKYSLNNLYLGDWKLKEDDPSIPYISGSLGLVASLCPSVTSVEIELITGLTDSDLLGLLSLENVRELDIIGGDAVENNMVTFEGGVVPLLKKFGSTLKVIMLSHLKNVHIRAIIDFCPELEILMLDENRSYTTVGKKEGAELNHYKRIKMQPLVLKNLKKLSVFSYNEFEIVSEEEKISSEDLLSLFASPSLINISVAGCDNLSIDYVLERAFEIHQFLSLELLEIAFCNSLTRKGIDVVLNQKTTALNQIEIDFCDNFTNDDISSLISNARSEKWQLSFVLDGNELNYM